MQDEREMNEHKYLFALHGRACRVFMQQRKNQIEKMQSNSLNLDNLTATILKLDSVKAGLRDEWTEDTPYDVKQHLAFVASN